MSILIGADMVPTKSNFDLFTNGDAVELVGQELLNILRQADYRIFNLEVPLTDVIHPIPKHGPNLMAPCCTINGYKALGVNLLALANNHIMDQDVQGLNSTLKVLDNAGIAYLGAGDTPEEAAKPYIFENAGKRIGVYACAEHEFSIISKTHSGANPYDPLESFDHVSKLKTECDFVIVLYHGGKEHYRYPSPDLRKVCRKFVERGAGLIICQHTHCIGCEEKYLDGIIVYGGGNFIFDNSDSEFWKTSLLIRINDDFCVSYIPICKKKNTIRLASAEQANIILSDFLKRSGQIREEDFIEKEYQSFAESMRNQYLYTMIPKWIGTRALNRLFGQHFLNWFIKIRFKKRQLLAIRNYIECESHHELFLKGVNEDRRKMNE